MTSTRNPALMVREEMRQLKAYHLDLPPYRHKLDQNEMPFDVPRRIKRQLADRLAERSWAIYPDFHSDDLRAALGSLHDWPAEGILVGNGSDELLGLTIEAVSRPGEQVLGTIPSFGLYKMFITRGAAKAHFIGPAQTLPVDELHAEVRRDPTRPVILCTPNNPTGDSVSPGRVAALLDDLQAPLILDNAYGEFSAYDYRPLLKDYPHLLLFRTFSKAWSLAGWRLGYLMADPAFIGELIKIKQPYNVNFASSMLGEVLVENRHIAERRIRTILGRRPQWQKMLDRMGFDVFPSDTNFVLFRCIPGQTPDSEPIRLGLHERGIRIRDISSYPGLSNCLRTAVGSGKALREVEAALREIFRESNLPIPEQTFQEAS